MNVRLYVAGAYLRLDVFDLYVHLHVSRVYVHLNVFRVHVHRRVFGVYVHLNEPRVYVHLSVLIMRLHRNMARKRADQHTMMDFFSSSLIFFLQNAILRISFPGQAFFWSTEMQPSRSFFSSSISASDFSTTKKMCLSTLGYSGVCLLCTPAVDRKTGPRCLSFREYFCMERFQKHICPCCCRVCIRLNHAMKGCLFG